MFDIEQAEEKIQNDYNKLVEYLEQDPRWEQLKPLRRLNGRYMSGVDNHRHIK